MMQRIWLASRRYLSSGFPSGFPLPLSSGIFLARFLGPLTPHLLILHDGGKGVVDTNLTRGREPDCDHGEGDFIIDLDLDPEPGGDFDLGLDFNEAGPGRFGPFDFDLAVIEVGRGGFDPLTMIWILMKMLRDN